MTISMTGYASATGGADGWRWTWEMKGVNGRGLDIRMRLPDIIEGLDGAIRPVAQNALSRGNVTISLRTFREGSEDGPGIEAVSIDRALDQVAAIEAAAMARGVDLAPSRATDILGLRALNETVRAPDDTAALKSALLQQFSAELLPAFTDMRRTEGAALAAILTGQLEAIAALTDRAAGQAEARREKVAEGLRAALQRIVDNADGVDADRVAQELALLGVKSDVSEEIDRLRAHVDAAGTLLDTDQPTGRKLDFLMQEFNREANTLCSKAQDAALTQTGLDLKTVIDQMREQVQNVE